jgi:hypothetical protein
MRRAAIVVLSILAGCAQGPGRLEATLNGYLGRPEAELLRGLGRPERSWPQADGSRVLRFARERTVQYGGQSRPSSDAPPRALAFGTYDPAGLAGRAATSAPGHIDDEAAVCAIDFAIDEQGIVRSWTPREGDCRAK